MRRQRFDSEFDEGKCASQETDGDESHESEVPPPGLIDVAKSVGAAFFGVQSEANRRRDFTRGRPIHFVVIGALATGVFVIVLLAIVHVILAQVGT